MPDPQTQTKTLTVGQLRQLAERARAKAEKGLAAEAKPLLADAQAGLRALREEAKRQADAIAAVLAETKERLKAAAAPKKKDDEGE